VFLAGGDKPRPYRTGWPRSRSGGLYARPNGLSQCGNRSDYGSINKGMHPPSAGQGRYLDGGRGGSIIIRFDCLHRRSVSFGCLK
jgi:hypothetical protein